jgi:hypothetical protein
VGAFATSVRNRMVMPVDLPDRELQALIQHELTHIFQYEILYQGRTGRAIYRRPPTWFMEGMASYYGNDETARDEMYMRDAVLSDQVPSVAAGPEGFFAYRFGHKVFEFIEAEWGEDVVREFVFAFRNTFGGRIERPFARVFNMDLEEFDARFRSWLRKRYIAYLERGTPAEFGRRFRTTAPGRSQELSPVAAPSGDLVAAFSTYKNDVDVVLFGVPDRKVYRNLSRRNSKRFDYLIAQELTVGGDHGRDLAYSPDGNLVAVFGRTERTRNLFLLDANRGGISREIEIPLPIDQSMQPAFSPDGRTIAFRAQLGGQADIFLLDLETEEITNLSNDEAYDAAPTFDPDGDAVVYSTEIGEYMKLVSVSLDDPEQREQLTFAEGNDEGPILSRDDQYVYFASDREDGIFDLYRAHLETRVLERLTYVFGAALNPTPVETLAGERVVFQAFYRGGWDLYVVDPNTGVEVGVAEPIQEPAEYEPFLPAVSMTVDPADGEPVGRRKLYIEDARVWVGVDQTNRFLSQTYISWADQYGDRRITLAFDSVDTFSNFVATWFNLEPRLQWGVSLFDNRSFYIYGFDPLRDQFTESEQVYRQTGASLLGRYPFSRNLRLQGSAGYIDRSADFPTIDPDSGEIGFVRQDDQIPYVSGGIAGDTVRYASHGPHGGSSFEFNLYYGHDLDEGGALVKQAVFEGRTYLPLSRRNEIAMRLYLAAADGNRPTIFAIGGYSTLRGLPFRSMPGNRAGLFNVEWRFPFIDNMNLAFLPIGGVRGRVFFDIGTAWFDTDAGEFNYLGEPGFTFVEDGRLVDGRAAYGVGLTLRVFGLPLNWDWVRLHDLKDSIGDWQSIFWIGYRF